MLEIAFEDVRAEYESVEIGPLILAEVRRGVDAVVWKYDPDVYGSGTSWADGVDDLVQDVMVNELINEGQLEYMMRTCRNLDGFRALMCLQVKRDLARGRTRTVIDNLLDRARPILHAAPFVVHEDRGRRELFSLDEAEVRAPMEDELLRGARLAVLVPRVGVGSSERAPLVYSDDNLRALLIGLAGDLRCRFSLANVDTVLRSFLTDFLPSFLEDDEGLSEVRSPTLTVEQSVMATSVAENVLNRLDEAQQGILRDKLAGFSDAEMAKSRGMSRPTLAARKQSVYEVIETEMAELERPLQLAAMSELGLALVKNGVAS